MAIRRPTKYKKRSLGGGGFGVVFMDLQVKVDQNIGIKVYAFRELKKGLKNPFYSRQHVLYYSSLKLLPIHIQQPIR